VNLSKFRSCESTTETLLTSLSFSGGTGSGCIAEMLLNGDLVCDTPLVIVTADPGMENSSTYDYVAEMSERFYEKGFDHRIVKTDLYGNFLAAVKRKDTRFDLPPFWTKNRKTGKRGRLMQKCTGAYKIAPMQRVVRKKLEEVAGISTSCKRFQQNCVRTWIGFSKDEISRIKEPKQKYIWLQYPLVAMGMTKNDVFRYYKKINRPLPPRSVCNACFANDVSHFKEMYENRPSDWEQAVAVDDACRDLSFMRVDDECYVSSTLKSLRQLCDEGFAESEKPDILCQTGFCFL
jgi:hypothetical protein